MDPVTAAPESPKEPTMSDLRALAQAADAAVEDGKEPIADGTIESPEVKSEVAPVAKVEPDKTPYVKAGESEEKLQKTWAEVQAERDALKAERAELEKLRTPAEPVKPVGHKDDTGRTASDYLSAAETFEAEGELDLAKMARKRAGDLQAHEQEAAQQATTQAAQAQWMESVNATLKAKPELADANTPLSLEVQKLLKSNPAFAMVPNGFAQAVEVAEAKLAGGRVTELTAERDTLKQQLADAQKKLAPAGRGAALPSGGGSPTTPTLADLRRMAVEADATA